MKFDFTDSEWIINDYYRCIQNNPENSDDLGAICYFGNVPENNENIRLISCAPKMIKALIDLINNTSKFHGWTHAEKNAKELIEKALNKSWSEINE